MARKEAIEYIKGYRKLDENLHNSAPPNSVAFIATKRCLEYWDMAIKALEQEPKTGNWIPVSERLPESSGVYIVTREFTDGFECADLVDACYFDGTGTWHNDNRINHGREYVDKKIKAWMPLPKPYRENEVEE